jgi:hypothetical protein
MIDDATAPARVPRWVTWVGGSVAAVLLLVLAGIAVIWWVLWDAQRPADGDRVAEQLGERVAVGIADDVEPSFAEPLDAEKLALRAVTDPRVPDDVEGDVEPEYDVVPLAFAGRSDADEGATIDLAVSVEVASWDSPGWFTKDRTAGSATTCWRLVVRAYRHTDTADHERIDCPPELSPVPLEPAPQPSLGPDAEQTVLQVLDGLPAGATADDATAALASAFPEADVRAVRAGDELVAAVGVARARDCVVAVRQDGRAAWRFSDFDRILVEPGELGCDPNLYLHPVTTH